MTPSTMNGSGTPPPVTLPGYVLTDLPTVRTAVGVTETPMSMDNDDIVLAIQTGANVADTLEFSDFVGGAASVDIICPNTNKSCSGTVPGVGTLTFFPLTGLMTFLWLMIPA